MSTIRKARLSDLAEIHRLISDASMRGAIYPPLSERQLGEDYVLVLDAPDGETLAAMAVLSIRGTRGHLRMIVIDQQFEHVELEKRILGVAHAMSVALGAPHFDISSLHSAA